MALAGKVALITGGAKNLGAEIARELAQLDIAGLALHYNSAKTKESADALQKEFSEKFPKVKVRFYQGDLTTEKPVDQLFATVVKDFGHLDIMINTIGMVLKKSMVDISEAEYDQMFAVNSKSAFLCLKAGAKYVADKGKLITIVTTLLAAFTGNYTLYAGAKAPVEHFTRGLAKELFPRQISVNTVAPGPMDTPFFYPQEAPQAVEFYKSSAIGNRLTEIYDIAPIVRFLVSEGGWINGQTIFANGGFATR